MAPTDETATAPALPYDILVEILLHLPAKSVLRFGAVCKPWRRLLSDPVFIRDHHRRAPLNILLNDLCVGDGGAISALPFPYTDESMAAPLYCGITSHNTHLEGCCDGLLLISCRCLWPPDLDADGKEYEYFVCNPATREFTRLPAGLGHLEFAGFYRHAPTGEYRVLCNNYTTSIHYEYLVATPGQRTARRLGPSDLWRNGDWPLIQAPVTYRGCLHWMQWRPSMGTVAFDTVLEEFRPMRGPVDGDARMKNVFGQLVGVDGTLGASVFFESEGAVKLWVLESYEKEAWAFKYNIDVSFLDQAWICSCMSVSHVSDEGDAVLITLGRIRVSVYNLRRGEVVSVNQVPFHGQRHATDHVYQESLVSPIPKGVADHTRRRDGILVDCLPRLD